MLARKDPYVPGAANALVEREKLVSYLLSTGHPQGRSKARFFLACGFSAERWEILAHALREQCVNNMVVQAVESWYGNKYVVDGPVITPDGSNPNVRTVWVIDKGQTQPRLVTAYPLGGMHDFGT